jgi:hypothetical protein
MRKTLFVSLVVFLFITATVKAQDFPATEKEVKELLCKHTWKGDSIQYSPSQIIALADAGVVMEIVFKADSTYAGTMATNMMEDGTAGKWKFDMAKQQVLMFKGGWSDTPKNIILSVTKDRLVMANPEKPDVLVVMKPKEK